MSNSRIEGRVIVVLRRAGDPRALLVRRASNAVLRGGAELLAALFSDGTASPVNGAMVGLGDEPPNPPYEAGPTVTGPDGAALLLRPTAVIQPADLTVATLASEFKVRVTARALLPAANAVDPADANNRVDITECSLGVLTPDGSGLARIYNRVVFEPVPKTGAHELALYFEVDFPYGA
jgi:hypothetical protein